MVGELRDLGKDQDGGKLFTYADLAAYQWKHWNEAYLKSLATAPQMIANEVGEPFVQYAVVSAEDTTPAPSAPLARTLKSYLRRLAWRVAELAIKCGQRLSD